MSSWWHNLKPRGLKKRVDDAPGKDTRLEKHADDQQWVKCPLTNELHPKDEIEANHWVTPAGFHMRIGPEPRFKSLFDGSWELIGLPPVPQDPLKFRDDKRYVDKLRAARSKTGHDDCMSAAFGSVGGCPTVVLVQDFAFMGGSLGLAAGEAFITAALAARARGAALIVVTASGGARMQEGVFSLMQMPRTTLAIQELHEAGLPYLVILTDPTSGGVTASYAMLGDVHIAEPGAMVAFSGPRVIEQTIRQKLPDGFQRSEYLLDKGMVDMVLHRGQMRETLGSLLGVLLARRMDEAHPELPLEEPVEAPPSQRPREARQRHQRAAE